MKDSIDFGAKTLIRAINLAEPLVRDSFDLGKDVTLRLIRGAPIDQHGRASDSELFERLDELVQNIGKAFEALFDNSETNARKGPPTEARVPY